MQKKTNLRAVAKSLLDHPPAKLRARKICTNWTEAEFEFLERLSKVRHDQPLGALVRDLAAKAIEDSQAAPEPGSPSNES